MCKGQSQAQKDRQYNSHKMQNKKDRSEGDEGISYGDIWGKEVEGTESKSSEVEECLAISWECKDDRLARQLKSR